jgi:hypothetical protein
MGNAILPVLLKLSQFAGSVLTPDPPKVTEDDLDALVFLVTSLRWTERFILVTTNVAASTRIEERCRYIEVVSFRGLGLQLDFQGESGRV